MSHNKLPINFIIIKHLSLLYQIQIYKLFPITATALPCSRMQTTFIKHCLSIHYTHIQQIFIINNLNTKNQTLSTIVIIKIVKNMQTYFVLHTLYCNFDSTNSKPRHAQHGTTTDLCKRKRRYKT